MFWLNDRYMKNKNPTGIIGYREKIINFRNKYENWKIIEDICYKTFFCSSRDFLALWNTRSWFSLTMDLTQKPRAL